MTEFIQYLIQFLPTLIAIVSELGVIKIAVNLIQKYTSTDGMKQLLEQNKLLMAQLNEQIQLNKKLMRKIDKINTNLNTEE